MTTLADSPERLVEMLDDAFNDGDLETVLTLYEESATVIATPSKTLRGHAQLRSFFETAMQSGLRAKQIKTRVIEVGDIALFLSRWILLRKGAAPGTAGQEFFATTIMRKQPDGSWKVLIDNPVGPAALEKE